MWEPHKLSAWDVSYAVNLGVACLLTYWIVTLLFHYVAGKPATPVGILWAVILAASLT